MNVIASLIFAIVFFVHVADLSVTPDKELTTNLREIWNNDFVIAISNVKSRKKQSEATVDILLAVKYDRSKKKLVLLLDRRSKRVIFESIDKDGHRTAEHLNLETPNVNSLLKNIIVLVRQNQPDPRMDVYIDCVYQGAIPLRKSFRKLADNEDNSLVEAFRERRNQMKVYPLSSIIDALKQENCPDNLADMDTLSSFFKHKESHELIATSPATSNHPDENFEESDTDQYRVKLKNKGNHRLRSKEHEVSDMFEDEDQFEDFNDSDFKQSRRSNRDKYRSTNEFEADQEVPSSHAKRLHQRTPSGRIAGPRHEKSAELNHNNYDELDALSQTNYKRVPRRGDIGIQSLDERVCLTDNQIVKTLNELIEATKKVWREIELNRLETQHLRQLIENCRACRVSLGGY